MKLSGGVHIENTYETMFNRLYRLLIFVLLCVLLSLIVGKESNYDVTISVLIASASFLFVEKMYPSVLIENKPVN